MAEIPKHLRYAPSHEWVHVEGDIALVGITDFAQDALGDVVHVELPKVGSNVQKGASVAEIESTKAVSEVYAPVSGTVVEVNSGLEGNEEAVNHSPFGAGWLFKVHMSANAELGTLLNAHAYAQHCENEAH